MMQSKPTKAWRLTKIGIGIFFVVIVMLPWLVDGYETYRLNQVDAYLL